MLGRARFLSDAGYSIMLFDFQAHGESAGERITFGHLESNDAQAPVDFLRAILPDEKIGVIGVSMGGAAVTLASPPLEADAMVLEMVYPTISEAVSNRLTMRLGGWSSALTPLLVWQFKIRLGIDAGKLRPVDKVGNISAVKLFVAGAEDQHTTLRESIQLFNAAREPKEFWAVKDAGHVDLHKSSKEEYERRILSFFDRYLRL
ncbi:MAG: alpha/beta hydrolase [Acidobacteriota bacterium]|nr:alpha/beta hydrolase [Acidobacteriota bacterium]